MPSGTVLQKKFIKKYDTLECSGFLLYKNANMNLWLVAYGSDHKITGKMFL